MCVREVAISCVHVVVCSNSSNSSGRVTSVKSAVDQKMECVGVYSMSECNFNLHPLEIFTLVNFTPPSVSLCWTVMHTDSRPLSVCVNE